MRTEEIVAAIESVDRRLNKSQAVPEEDRLINISPAYAHYGWGHKAAPIPEEALAALKLEDKSGDRRWERHFRRSRFDVGVYRSSVGFYWCLRYDTAMGEHFLVHVGSAADVAESFGDG